MRPPLKKAMFHLAWSPDSLPTTEAIAPLVEYLDVHLVALNSALLVANFNRVLQEVWEVVLGELAAQMDGNAEVEKISSFGAQVKLVRRDDEAYPSCLVGAFPRLSEKR